MAGPKAVMSLVVITGLLMHKARSQLCANEDIPNLPNMEFRYVFNKIDSTDTPLHDGFLTEGWYRTHAPMPEQPPDTIYRCGTKFPIWLNGTNPATENAVTRDACQLDLISQCSKTYNIQVARCSDSYLYYLRPTGSTSVGYCIGTGVDGDRPTYTAPRPSVSAALDEVLPGAVYRTIISCDFEPSATQVNLLYMVHWFRDGQLRYNTPVASFADRDRFLIREEDFDNGIFYMGNTLSCAVTALEIENGPAGKRSETSEDFFVGIRILTTSLNFTATDDKSRRTIRLQPTVPVGCQGSNSCSIRLTTYLPERPIKEECQGLAFEHSSCGTLLHSETYDSVLELLVAANDPGQPRQDRDDHYLVYITTNDTPENLLWKKYVLPSISVTITSGGVGSIVRGRCFAAYDPHFTTFDSRHFSDHREGTMILYRNTKYHTEVQISTKPCSTWSSFTCVCGVAARAGFDVYVINRCGNAAEARYRFCHSSSRSLTVRGTSYSETKIELPYGTYVTVNRGSNLRVNIYPSSFDEDNTVGLCGTLDQNRDNDFHRRDGTIMSLDYHLQYPSRHGSSEPLEFVDEWRVTSEDEDLFSNKFNTTSLRPSSDKICVCENDTVKDSGGGSVLTPSVPCKSNGAAVCKIVQGGKVLEAKHCENIAVPGRRRRSVTRRSTATVPVKNIRNILSDNTRTKRAVPVANGWAEDDANQFCTSTFNSQPAYNLCNQLPSVETQTSIDVCSTDIMLSNGTDYVAESFDGMVSACNEELVRNLTLVRAAADGDPLPDMIKAVSCPNNCSDNGVCDDGACICDEGAGASDCSVDLTTAVHVSSLLDGGLCDRSLEQCDSAIVFGGAFVDGEDLLCQLQEFTENEFGQRTYGSVNTVSASFETYIEVECPVNSTRQRRSADGVAAGDNSTFVTGYSVAVTNNAELYSERKDLFVYDSQCQTFEEVGETITFSLIDGHCFIDNACVTEGQVSATDECYVCQPQTATGIWSRDDTKEGCEPLVGPTSRPVEDGGSGGLDTVPIIIGAVVGGVFAVIVAVIIGVAIVKSNRSMKVGSIVTLDRP